MRVRDVRMGTKFVLEDRGGIWEKRAETTARCVFGGKEQYGKDMEVDPEAFAFGLFGMAAAVQAEQAAPVPRRNLVDGAGLRVTVVDGGEAVLAECGDAGPALAVALSSADWILVTPPCKRRKREYLVVDTYVDLDERSMRVEVREEESAGGLDSEDEMPEAEQKSGPYSVGGPATYE